MKEVNNLTEAAIIDIVQRYMKTAAFTDRKITDTPTDNLAVVNRKFITLNGTSANRPTTSIIGQRYFDTTINKPIYWNGTGFVDSASNYV